MISSPLSESGARCRGPGLPRRWFSRGCGGNHHQRRALSRITRKLDLDQSQREHLQKLWSEFTQLREEWRLSLDDSRATLATLLEQPDIDRAHAQTLVEQQMDLLHRRCSAVIGAVVDFSEQLNPPQRQHVQRWLTRKSKRWAV